MSVMLLCSGQGAQHPEMFAGLAQEPAAKPILDLASSHLGTDVRSLNEKGTGLALGSNRVAQILITAHCLAVRDVLGPEIGEIFLGYSVGEIAAAACAGCIGPETAFLLIEDRVRCMDEARHAAGEAQGMLAVIGIPADEARGIAGEAGVAVAIVNGRDHVVLGGPADRIGGLEQALPTRGAHTVRRLMVEVASHTPFIKAAGEAFEAVLRQIDWRPPRGVLLTGIDGRSITTHDDAVNALSNQLWRPLDFALALELAVEHGAGRALEIGPGQGLTRIAADVLPDLPVRAHENFRSGSGMRKWLSMNADISHL